MKPRIRWIWRPITRIAAVIAVVEVVDYDAANHSNDYCTNIDQNLSAGPQWAKQKNNACQPARELRNSQNHAPAHDI